MERAEHAGPVSRRTRPAKSALSRAAIVTAALAVLDADGLDTVSMRRVAQQLDTGPASLYVYVANREELLALVHDRVLGEVDLTITPDHDWRARLLILIEDTIAALGRRRGIATVAMAAILTGPNALALVEAMLVLLARAGLDGPTMAWAIDLLFLHISAAATEESLHADQANAGGTEHEAVAAADQVFATLSASEFPMISALRADLVSGPGELRRRWALTALLNGILATKAGNPDD